jgi:hypothetical protein
MSATGTPQPLTIVRPGEGRTGNLGPIGVVFKLWGEDTDDAHRKCSVLLGETAHR